MWCRTRGFSRIFQRQGGNVVTFLMEHERMSYVEALKWLGDKHNIEIEETKPSEEQQQAASERENLGVVVNYASGYFMCCGTTRKAKPSA